MSIKKILAIGKKDMVNLFSLSGIEGFVVMNYDDLKSLFDHLCINFKSYAGILSTIEQELINTKLYNRILALEIPILQLTSNNQDDISNEKNKKKKNKTELEILVEQAIGIKLNNLNF